MASLAKFTALSLTVLVESRRVPGWEAIGTTLSRLQSLTAAIETGWVRCPLAGVTSDDDLAGERSTSLGNAYSYTRDCRRDNAGDSNCDVADLEDSPFHDAHGSPIRPLNCRIHPSSARRAFSVLVLYDHSISTFTRIRGSAHAIPSFVRHATVRWGRVDV